jgi:hypothetical protein
MGRHFAGSGTGAKTKRKEMTVKTTEKMTVNGEPARGGRGLPSAARLVENQLERNPLVALAGHFAGLLLGLFRRSAATTRHDSATNQQRPARNQQEPATNQQGSATNQQGSATKQQGSATKQFGSAGKRRLSGRRTRQRTGFGRSVAASASAVAVFGGSAGKEVRHG